jgi:23S rRNA pseudouridine2457 synthase
MTVVFNKPYGVLSQFTPEPGSRWRTLAEFGLPKSVYAAGRLDADSEGMLVLTDEPRLVDELLDPEKAHPREYWAQVEGRPAPEALARLASGVHLGERGTRPCLVSAIAPPDLPPRIPAIRIRKTITDSWISLTLTEGKNRQVRRMTAAVGHPTLRLYRSRIGRLELAALRLAPSKWRALSVPEKASLVS